MIRPDSHILKATLKQYRKSKKLPKQIAKAATQPLLWFADKDYLEQPFLTVLDDGEVSWKWLSPAEWIYQEFIFCTRGQRADLQDALTWNHISVDPTNPNKIRSLLIAEELRTTTAHTTHPKSSGASRNWHRNRSTLQGNSATATVVWSGEVTFPEGLIEQEEMPGRAQTHAITSLEWVADVYPNHKENKFDNAEQFWQPLNDLGNYATAHIAHAMQLMLYCKYGDRHPVEVVPEKSLNKKPTLNRNRLWASSTGPRLLLLDRMPTTQRNQGSEGTHASPKPHRRRGHWKTLRHPRYRHHPQYLEKIYCKPSFVGPQQVSYEGNIYRLVQPLDEIMNHGA